MRDLRKRDFRRILIIKPSSFGDVIHALPVLNGLRQRYPSAHIAWLVANSCAGLLERHTALNEIIRFDRKRYGSLGRNLRVSVEFMEFLNQLRARRFELVVDLQGLFRSGFLALASGAPYRVGFANAREMAWMFYTHRVAVPNRDMHAVDRNYLFAKRLGFEHVPIAFHLPVQERAVTMAEHMLAARGLRRGEQYVLMGPGTRWETKLWPARYFAQVARQIMDHTPLRVVLIGMDVEVPLANEVAQLAGNGIINLAGQTSLAELTALVAGATAVVMHDSGPMHLATAFNKPMVAIYGPTNPQRTGPYNRPESIARLELECSPCYLKRVSECPHRHRCMNELTPDLVFQRVMRVLEAPAGVP